MTEAVIAAYNATLEAALAGGELDREALGRFLDDELSWKFPSSVEDLGAPRVVSGRDAMLDFLAAGVDGFYQRGSMHFDWTYYPGARDTVTARLRLRALTVAGAPYANDYLLLYQLREGRIWQVIEMFDTQPLRKMAAQAS